MYGLRSAIGLLVASCALANSHREAPTTLDQGSAITDFYAFVRPDDASKVTFILSVESAFDPTAVYAIKIDNNSYEFRVPQLARDRIVDRGNGVRVFVGTSSIAVEAPASGVIRTWAAMYRTKISARRVPDEGALVEIQRIGNPLDDGPLQLDTRAPSGFPNGRGLTDDVMAIALHTPPAPPRKGAYLDVFPYVKTAPVAAKAGDPQITLAAGYIQKLRETGDGSYLDRAAKILDTVLTKDGGNYEAQRLRNEIALQLHEFTKVVEESRRLSALSPKDPRNFGTLGDALMELGQYDKAAGAYQQMVDLRPGLSSLNRVAFYRFVTGDSDGAIAAMNQAINAGSAVPENLAWCLVDLGWMYFKTGKIDDAAAAFHQALVVFPGYHRASAGMGQTLAAQGKIPEAIESYQRAQAVVPMPDYAAALAALYEIGGKSGEGKKQQALLDMLDQIGLAKGETTNRNMVVAYADQGRKLDRALQLAQAELNSRKDVYTYDALAWALFKNGRYVEAEEASAKALAMKTAEPAFYYHAGMIAAAAHRPAAAKEYLERALALNPKFDPRQAAVAAKTLAAPNYAAVQPPSIENTAPCTNCASSDAR
jgi:tetratricopeptide (TPR) repeat protein